MNKKGFLRALKRSLRPLSKEERQASLAYYTEMIHAGMEEGLSEEQAVARLGSAENIAAQLLKEHGKELASGKRSISTAGIAALAVMAAPVWLPIALAVFAVLLSAVAALLAVYVSLWMVITSLYAAVIVLLIGGPAGLLGVAAGFAKGNPFQALAFLAAGCVCAGLGLLLLPALNCCARGFARFTRWSANGIISICGRRRS